MTIDIIRIRPHVPRLIGALITGERRERGGKGKGKVTLAISACNASDAIKTETWNSPTRETVQCNNVYIFHETPPPPLPALDIEQLSPTRYSDRLFNYRVETRRVSLIFAFWMRRGWRGGENSSPSSSSNCDCVRSRINGSCIPSVCSSSE